MNNTALVVAFVVVVAALGVGFDTLGTSTPAAFSLGLVGDSLAVGLSPHLRKLASTGPGAFVAETHGGTTTQHQITRGWLASVLAKKPSVVIVVTGTNDTAIRPTSEALRPWVRKVLESCKVAGARCVWALPPPMPWPLDPLTEALKAEGATTIDPPADLQRAPDRIHLTPDGYGKWAAHLWKVVSP